MKSMKIAKKRLKDLPPRKERLKRVKREKLKAVGLKMVKSEG